MKPDPKISEASAIITLWADARGILEHSTAQAQCLKLVSEVGELSDAIIKHEDATDALGDVFVALTLTAKHLGIPMQDALAQAWDQIKDRRGRMIAGGAFVKEKGAQ